MTPFVGTVLAFGFPFAPKTWAQCNGQLLAINTNQALFALLGVQFGGNGSTTFGLPDLRGRAAISQGTLPGVGTYPMGAKSGTETVTLLSANLPVHNHTATAVAASGGSTLGIAITSASVLGSGTTSPVGALFASAHTAGGATYAAGTSTPVVALAANSISLTNGGGGLPGIGVGAAGASTPVSIIQPYLAVNYCIALQGIFPSRN